ncbi:MAG: tRNA lysidine(34) synthetase TilS [Bacteroidales bacterium]|nr:tRNA lysidine(34) synthetase TilS [Bacteroidales bacterium]
MRVLLAVSGGIDSMYMLHKAPELFPGVLYAVAHCNFKLRGADSDSDEAFVCQESAKLGIECYVNHFDTESYAAAHGVSIEMAARTLRYGWFRMLCAEKGFDALATAHNANDNAETLILNLLRGTGTRGLRGIPGAADAAGRRESASECPVLIRPLLNTGREEIRAWMEAKGYGWREDKTNAENGPKRNKIRNQVFPVFAEINPSFIRTLSADMERFAQTDDIAEDYYQEAASRIVKSAHGNTEGPILEISVTGLLALRHWRYVLWRILEDCSFSAETFDKLCKLLERYRAETPGTVTLSGKTFQSPSCILRARKKSLILETRRAD